MADPTSLWPDRIGWILGTGGLLAGLTALVTAIFNRKKPRSETANLDAATDNLRISGVAHLLRLTNKIAIMEEQFERRDQEAREEIQRLRAENESFRRTILTRNNGRLR